MSDKTESATTFKLQKAKEQGQVSKSTELNTCVFLLISLLTAMLIYSKTAQEIKSIVKNCLSLLNGFTLSLSSFIQLHNIILKKVVYLWLPLAIAGMFALSISSIVQTGWIWTLKPLQINFKRLNPLQNIKKIFSVKVIFELIKINLKWFVVFIFLIYKIRQLMVVFIKHLHFYSIHEMYTLLPLMSTFILQLMLLLSGLALIDKRYLRWKFFKDNRMTKQEVKEEYKQREGCPRVKSKIRQLQQKLRQKTTSLSQVKTADVLIANPNHLAIALKYDSFCMPAPKVVCKAKGELAQKIKQIARRYQIPIIENKAFAATLFKDVELNGWIRLEHFPIAACIFKEIYANKERNA